MSTGSTGCPSQSIFPVATIRNAASAGIKSSQLAPTTAAGLIRRTNAFTRQSVNMGPSGHSWLKRLAPEAASSAPSGGAMCSTQNSTEAHGLMQMFVSLIPKCSIRVSSSDPGQDNLLESSVDTHGRNWKSIAQLHFQDRSALSLKNRHALLLRRQARGIQNQRDFLPSLESDGPGPQQGALTTPGHSPHSSQSAADEFESTPDNQNDIQNSLPHSHGNSASIPTVVSSGGFGGDSFTPFGQNSNVALDMSTYNNNFFADDMSQLIQDSSFSPEQLQQSHQQQHVYPEMSSFNPLPAGIDYSVPPTPPSMVQNSKGSSEETEWEEFLCLGISCPRKGLEAFKMAVLEAVTKGPSCLASDDDDKVQIMLKVRRKPQVVFESRKT